MLPLILVPRHPPPNSKYLSLAPEHFRGIYLVHHQMSKTNPESMNLVFFMKMSLMYFLIQRVFQKEVDWAAHYIIQDQNIKSKSGHPLVSSLEQFLQQKFSLLSKKFEILRQLFEFATTFQIQKRIVFVETICRNTVFV